MDNLTNEQRRKNMQRIHSKDTSIELILRKALWRKGYRYRKNYKILPGSPDIAITKYQIAIFCDSEFFHGKDWEKLRLRLENGSNSIIGSEKSQGTWSGIKKMSGHCASGNGMCYGSGGRISGSTRMTA